MLSLLRPRRERAPQPEPESQPEATQELDPKMREKLLWELRVQREGKATQKGYDPREAPAELARLERLSAGEAYVDEQQADDVSELQQAEAVRQAAEQDRLAKVLPQEAAAMAETMKATLASARERPNKVRFERRFNESLQKSLQEEDEREKRLKEQADLQRYREQDSREERRKIGEEYRRWEDNKQNDPIRAEYAARTSDEQFRQLAAEKATAHLKEAPGNEESIDDIAPSEEGELDNFDEITTEEMVPGPAKSEPVAEDLPEDPTDEDLEVLRTGYADRAKPKGIRRREIEDEAGRVRAEKWEEISSKLQNLQQEMQRDGYPAEDQREILETMSQFLLEADEKRRRFAAERKRPAAKATSAAYRKKMKLDASPEA